MNQLAFGIAAAILATAPSAFAQCSGFDQRFGSPQGGLPDQLVQSIALGWTFTSPAGSPWTTIDIDTHGRVFSTGATGGTSDFDPTPAEFIALDHVAPLHADVVPGVAGDVWFFTDPAAGAGGEAVITWLDCEPFAGGAVFTFQLILRGDGSMTWLYDARVPIIAAFGIGSSEAIIGTSDGIDALAAPSVNLSDALPSGAGSILSPNGDGMLYEDMPATGGSFDLASTQFDLFPAGGPGSGYICIANPCEFAFAEKTGISCDFGTPQGPPVAIAWDPDGVGGYVVSPSTAVFDPIDIGSPIAVTDDSITTVSLGGGTFTMPGGSVVTDLDIDSNGRVNVVGGALSDFTPSASELVTNACIAPFWADLSPQNGGGVSFFTDGVTAANITWIDTPEFGLANALTFQLQLDLTDDSWDLVLESIGEFGLASNLLIGCSGGGGVAPAESDLSTIPLVTGGVPDIFELFDGLIPEPQDLQAPMTTITADYDFLSLPVVGTVFQTAISGLPASNAGCVVLLGVTNPMIPLNLVFTALPNSCILQNGVELGDTGFISAPGAATASFDIDLTSAGPSAVGFPVMLQGIMVDFTLPWASQVAVATTNAIETLFGM